MSVRHRYVEDWEERSRTGSNSRRADEWLSTPRARDASLAYQAGRRYVRPACTSRAVAAARWSLRRSLWSGLR